MRPLVLLLVLTACEPKSDAFDSGSVATLPSGGQAAGAPAGTPGTVDDCTAAGFADGTAGLSGDALKSAVQALTAAHECRDYTGETIFMFTRLDKVNDEVECVYTGRRTPVTVAKPPEDDMNTEHTWPQSEGADTNPARCDLHHLYPTDSDTNAQRGNWPFGVVVSNIGFEQGGSKLGREASGATVFEPRDVHKGNVARSMLYFSARYGYSVDPARKALFQQWHLDDPVDAAELDRTWMIADRQGAANPYVVCPDLVGRL